MFLKPGAFLKLHSGTIVANRSLPGPHHESQIERAACNNMGCPTLLTQFLAKLPLEYLNMTPMNVAFARSIFRTKLYQVDELLRKLALRLE